jgi:hypothetical protein
MPSQWRKGCPYLNANQARSSLPCLSGSGAALKWRAGALARALACTSAGAVTGTGECLGPDHIGVPWVGRQGLLPLALAPGPRPVDTDALHCFSSPWLGTPSRGAMAGSPALLARLFGERYEFRPPWRVTRRWLPGGMSWCADRSSEGATPPGRGRCAGLTCPRRAAAAPPVHGRSAARPDGGLPPRRHSGGEQHTDRYDGGAASWPADLPRCRFRCLRTRWSPSRPL